MDRPVTEKQNQHINFMCKILRCDNPNCKTLEEAKKWISENQEEYRLKLAALNAWLDACYESEDWGCK